MYMICFLYHNISSVKAEMAPISCFQILMASTSLVNSSIDLCLLLKNLSGYFIWWILETSRMYRFLDLRHSIIFKEFNVKHIMSNTVQKDIRREMLRLLFPVGKWT